MINRPIHFGIFAQSVAWLAAFIGFHYNGQRGQRSKALEIR